MRRFVAGAAISATASCLLAQTPTAVPVLTWRYNLTQSGANTQETMLTPANVDSDGFGKLFSLPVDDRVFAQPLYVPALKMSNGQVHNVLFVATENDSIYAFDADVGGNPLWKVSLLTAAHGAGAGATPVPQSDVAPSEDIGPNIGITGTPAIDSSSGTMFVVANTKESGKYFSRLHAINITNGAERSGSPVAITATAPGSGDGSSGGEVPFLPLWTNQRAALAYYNGFVYIAYSSHGDLSPYHGWLFAYNGTTLKQTAAMCLSPNDLGASVWGSGAGLPIDTSISGGRMFVVTANGNRTTPFKEGSDYGQSVIAFNIANGQLTPTDAWTEFDYQGNNTQDWDQASGGLVMLPDQGGPYPHLVVTAGKEGRITVLNRDHLGGWASGASSNTNAVQDFAVHGIPQGEGFWGTGAYWNGNLYVWAGGDDGGTPNVGMQFKLTNGVLTTTPSSETTFTSAFPGPTFSISSNGTKDGIVWAVKADQFNSGGPAVLYAFDADDLTNILFASDKKSSDAAGPANKFSVPVVTNGKVYIAARGEVDVYGLLDSDQTAAAPTINPDGGTFKTAQTVTMSSATGTAQIFFTLDGATPTTSSKQYTGPITISTDTTLKAVASAPGFLQSAVTTAKFTFSDQVPAVTFKPAAGSYQNAQKVTIADSSSGAKIYYTTNGSTPTTSSHLYTGPVSVPVSETLKAIAVVAGLRNSNVGTAAYAIREGGKYINFGNGFSSTTGMKLNGSAIATGGRLELTHGGLWEGGSAWWATPIGIQSFTTSFEFQLSNAQGNGFTFTIQNMGKTALGGDSAGLAYQNILKSVAVKFNFYNYMNEGDDSTGVYTDGEPPLTPTVNISDSGIQLGSGDEIEATITYNGTTLALHLRDLVSNDTFTMSKTINIPQVVGGDTAYVGFTGGTGGLSSTQKILNWTYATQSVPPAFAPAGGTYRAAQKVVLTSATPGAAIYYTTNGKTPTAVSKRYSTAIAVGDASETIEAIAISSAEGQSNVSVAEYKINPSSTGAQFSLSATAPDSLAQGKSEGVAVKIAPMNGFKGKVSLHCAVAPDFSAANEPPICAVSQPSAISGTSSVGATLTISAHPETSPGLYTATIQGSSGTLTRSTSVTIRVTGHSVAPAFTLSGSPVNVGSPGDTVTVPVTVTPVDGFTGNVSVACIVTGKTSGAKDLPTCSASQPSAILSIEPVTSTLSIKTDASTSIGYYTATVTASAPGLNQTMEIAITVNDPAGTTFSISGTDIGIVQAGTPATSTITIAPKGGFTGNVKLACSVASGPSGGIDAPTCSVVQPDSIAMASPVTSTLTVQTTGSTSAALHLPLRQVLALGGSGTLAALLLFVPVQRRRWQGYFGLVALLLLSVGASACGVSATPNASGTTPGSYTVTVTGTDGPLKVSTALTFLVN